MSASLILTNAKETCRYDSATSKFLLGGATSGSQSIATALAQSAKTTSIDGLPCEVTVRYIDQAFSTRFEVIRGTYNSSDNSVTRAATVASSSGTGQISFDETTGVDNLVIYGTTSHAVNGVQVLQKVDSFSGLDTLVTATTLTELTGTLITITPTISTSVLDFSCRLDTRMSGSNSVKDLRGRVTAQYLNSSSTWVQSGMSYFLGHTNITPFSASPVVYAPTVVVGQLSESNKDGNGNWQFRIAGEADFANNTLQNFSSFWSCQEIIKY